VCLADVDHEQMNIQCSSDSNAAGGRVDAEKVTASTSGGKQIF